MTRFRWNAWNMESATKHGCTIGEIEEVVRRALCAGRARRTRDGAYRVEGVGRGSRSIEVVFAFDSRNEIWDDEVIFAFHAMPLTRRRA